MPSSSTNAYIIRMGKGVLAQPSVETCEHILHFCKRERKLDHARGIHAYLQEVGLVAHNVLGDRLVSLLIEQGKICKAEHFMHKAASGYDSWCNSLIIGYVKNEMFQQAVTLYASVRQHDSCFLNEFTFMALFKACTLTKDLETGSQLHADTIKGGFMEINDYISCALLHMYAKCGSLANAQEVMTNLRDPTIVSWNTLIAGYVEHRHAKEALYCFEQMQLLGVSPNAVTFVCALKACGCVGAINKGEEIHMEAARQGFGKNIFVGNTLIDMYATCGILGKAKEVLDNLPNRDTVSWNALIAGYAEHGLSKVALSSFEQMQGEGVPLNASTFVSVLKACAVTGCIDKGEEIHYNVAKRGLENNLHVGSTLVDMYAKCNRLPKAQEVFDKLSSRDTVSWNALLAGYAEHGCGQEALNRFKQMQLENVLPDAVTFAAILKACRVLRCIHKGQEFHAEIARNGLGQDTTVGSSLVDMYAKCGLLSKAQELVDKFSVRSTALWSALIGGYAEYGYGEEAFDCFQQMQMEGMSPNAITYLGMLKLSGSIGASDKGQEMHADLARQGLESDVVLGSTLVDMYGKCCLLAKAQEVFDKLHSRNAVTWNALIAGYAQVGENERVFACFDRMIAEGDKPNEVTFLNLLSACCHTGLLERGQTLFECMSGEYGVVATLEHITCIIDLLGRAGQLGKAAELFKVSTKPDLGVWLTLLGAGEKWGNVSVASYAFDCVMRLDPEDALEGSESSLGRNL